ncbi:hypothetical protein AAC387_Pa01g3352 [Persea americana]
MGTGKETSVFGEDDDEGKEAAPWGLVLDLAQIRELNFEGTRYLLGLASTCRPFQSHCRFQRIPRKKDLIRWSRSISTDCQVVSARMAQNLSSIVAE